MRESFKIFFLVVLLWGAPFLSVPTLAFKFSPMNIYLTPSGQGKGQIVFVENDSDEKTAIQISLHKRIMKEDGQEDRPEAEGEFTLFPSQFILNPKEKRSVRITWLGPSQMDKEEAYRLIAEQLPIDMEKKDKNDRKANIKILLKYVASLYVVPEKVASDIQVSEMKYLPEEKKLGFVLENRGTKHQLLTKLKIKLEGPPAHSGNGSVQKKKFALFLEGENLTGIDGENILAKGKRLFKIPWPSAFSPEDLTQIKVDLDFER